MLAWKVLFFERGDFSTGFWFVSNNFQKSCLVIIENPFSTSCLTLPKLHFIPGTNNTFSISVALPYFLWITMFPMPSAAKVLLFASLIFNLLLASKSLSHSLWSVIWLKHPMSKYQASEWGVPSLVATNRTRSSSETSSWATLAFSSLFLVCH